MASADITTKAGLSAETRSYEEFLQSKNLRFRANGLDIQSEDIHPKLFGFQRDITAWALRKGRAAIFADCGLGKTFCQVEWSRHIPGRVLIFAPLCVAEQTIGEAHKIDLEIGEFGSGSRIEIINYEMLHKVKPDEWTGVVLDESSILKSVDGKIRSRLLEMFQETAYRLCCTATPAPNDPTEIGNHSHFLGIMTRAEMLGSFFVNRGEGNRSWDLKGHAKESFYKWLASWACFLRRPSDLGYSDEGFELPSLEIRGEIIPIDIPSPGRLFPDKLRGVADRAAVRKSTASMRVSRAAEIIQQSEGQVIAWCGLNDEQDSLAQLLGSSCASITGSQTNDRKIELMRQFLSGRARILVSKVDIIGFGMNLQCAKTQVFVGLGDSYEKYYQAIRRSWRYPQSDPVTVWIVLTDLEEEILKNVKRKEAEAAKLQESMVGRIAEFEIAEISGREVVAPYSESKEAEGDWILWRGDCNPIMAAMDPQSIDLAVFSPPFAELYTYSASERDLGNARTLKEFLEHFAFFCSHLLRVMKPGRIVACHCQQIALQKAKHGVIGLRDFRGSLIQVFEASGFIYHGEITIDKNPQAQAIRTRTKGLGFAQLEKDASWMRPALADYIILLRTPGENAVNVEPDCTREEWIEWASPVWYHCGNSKTLQTVEAREQADEKHICALQLETIQRCIRLWSNKDELILSPFAGIGSEGYEALRSGRKFVGVELKASYHRVAVKNLKAAENSKQSNILAM